MENITDSNLPEEHELNFTGNFSRGKQKVQQPEHPSLKIDRGFELALLNPYNRGGSATQCRAIVPSPLLRIEGR